MKPRIQRILVPLDVSEYAEAATLRACEIARQYQAQVTGLVILDSPGIASDLAPLEVSHWQTVHDAVSDALEDAEKRIHTALEQFASICDEEGISHKEIEIEGVPANRILEQGIYHDLIVMGQRTFFHFETRASGDGHSLEQVLDHTITPVLAVPCKPKEDLKRVLITFDGTFNAGRALQDFAAFGDPEQMEVTILTSHSEKNTGEALVKRASMFLTSHGFTDIKTAVTKEGIAKAVEEHYLNNVDLIVAGIHNRRPIADFLVGSFTRKLLGWGNTTLLLSQ